jgi:hypothetical protein
MFLSTVSNPNPMNNLLFGGHLKGLRKARILPEANIAIEL